MDIKYLLNVVISARGDSLTPKIISLLSKPGIAILLPFMTALNPAPATMDASIAL